MINEEEIRNIHVTNAGIVLISSLFPVLFDKLGLLNKSKSDFKDIDSKICAVFVIQYLVNKCQKRLKGEDLILNGILVNYPFASSLSTDYNLHDHEIKILEQLLLDVKMSWKRLQKVSIEGMQYSFFLRNGNLVENDDEWVLKVDKTPFDILIQIPLEYHHINYPWMKKPINVLWE